MVVLPARSSLSLQEVLELGDGASTDSGWGGSASSSGEEKSSGRERNGDSEGDGDGDERSTGSGGSVGEGVVSGSELAVFLFQGGVKGSSRGGSDAALQAIDDDNNDPSAVVAQGKATKAAQSQSRSRSPHLLPSSEDAFFEYSGSGCGGSSGKALGDLRTGELGSGSAVDKATTRESGDEDAAAMDGVDFAEPREAVVDRGTEPSSLTGELRGVDFVDFPVNTSPRGAANEPSSQSVLTLSNGEVKTWETKRDARSANRY